MGKYEFRPSNVVGGAYLALLTYSASKLILDFRPDSLLLMQLAFEGDHQLILVFIVSVSPYSMALYIMSTYLWIEGQHDSRITYDFEPSRMQLRLSNICRFILIILLSLKAFFPQSHDSLVVFLLAIAALVTLEKTFFLQIPRRIKNGTIGQSSVLLGAPHLDILCLVFLTLIFMVSSFTTASAEARVILFAILTPFVFLCTIGSVVRLFAARQALTQAFKAFAGTPELRRTSASGGE